MPGDEEVILDVLAPVDSEPGGVLRLMDELLDPIRCPVDCVCKDSGILMGDLERDAADGACDDGFAFPEPFGNGEAKTFLQRFLQDDRRSALERVDLDIACR